MTERRFDYSNLPPELMERPQWLLWRYEQRSEGGKPTKRPYTCMGYAASTKNPQHWSTFECALKMSRRPDFGDGIGFVFTAEDPFCGIDCDNAWLSDATEMAPWALAVDQRFCDTYREESPSGTGFKIWCKAKPPRSAKWPMGSGAFEIYDHSRFFTVTGRADDSIPRVITDHQRDIELLVANLERFRKKDSPGRIQESIPPGQRHPTLVSLAGTMFRRGMCAEAIEAALLVVNERQCDPPHTPEHVRQQIVRSMERWSREDY